MTLIETGGVLFFIGILFGWRYYDADTWSSNTGEVVSYIFCTCGAICIVGGVIQRLIEWWVLR